MFFDADGLGIVLLIVLLILLIIFGPIITIWSLNTLFPSLEIPTNLATWFATLWLGGVISKTTLNKKSS